jgi:long-subunit fatty acid transport protein
MKRRLALLAVGFAALASTVATVATSRPAFAGGYEFPSNGTEALGRGGTFTAKADTPLALDYNVAGLARQRGTRVLVDGNIILHDYELTRAGVYPAEAESNAGAPWVGQPFPTVRNQGGPFFAPFLGITTDFGKLDRWTFGLGVYGPSAYGKRHFPTEIEVNGAKWPSPSRFDVVNEDLLIVFPTLAAAVRATRWLDIGVGLHVAVGHFDLSNVSQVGAIVPAICPNWEASGCNSEVRLNLTGATATASLGFMVKPIRPLSIGLNVRGPVYLEASGTAGATPPTAQPLPINDAPATFKTTLPWVVRIGLRYAFYRDKVDGFEHGDIEVDGTYESWSQAQGEGDLIQIPRLALFSDINARLWHRYRDTFSVRVGGSYNLRLPAGVLTFRLGFFFDSAATTKNDTRLDFNTGAKYAPTVGVGYRVRGVAVNVAYAYLYEPERIVTNGRLGVLDGSTGLDRDVDGNFTSVINNGRYQARTQIISVGINVAFDEALKRTRPLRYD